MFHVRTMSVKDIVFAVHLTDTMNWKLSDEDFEFMMELEPNGCFILICNSGRVGIVTTISFGKVGWLGNLIVTERHRRRGAGSLLVRHSVRYLTNKNVETIGLYTYLDKVPFYRRFGFEYDSEFVSLKGKGFFSPAGTHIREAKKEDIKKVVDYDYFCFGASRRKLLEPILLDPDNLCYISTQNGRMYGYIAAKVYEGTAEVGPLVCRQGRIAIAIDLLKATLSSLEGFEVSMCIPKKESTILHMLMKSGFSENFHLARMFYGRPVITDRIYMAESLERG